MFSAMDTQQLIFLAIMLISVILFITEWLRVDVVALLIILALAMTGLIDVKEAFSGLASEPAVIVAAVFVLSAGLASTGVTDVIGSAVGRLSGASEARAILVVMTAVAIMSAFTHHLMITAMMLPIVMKLCRDRKLHASRLLIPMATAASLGTTLTLIGAPAFLLANNILTRAGEPGLKIFSSSAVGGPLVIAGIGFILLTKWLLPKTSGVDASEDRFKLNDISTELIIPEGSRWIGKTLNALRAETEKRFKVISWIRNQRVQSLNQEAATLKQGDILLVRTGSDELISFEETQGLTLAVVKKYENRLADGHAPLAEEEQQILKGIIAPKSEFVGSTISQLRFYNRFGAIALGLWRKRGWMTDSISEVPLLPGDLIVLWGPEDRLETLSRHRGFLMLMPFQAQLKKHFNIKISVIIMLASITAAAAGWLPAYLAFAAGAVAMVLTGCVTIDQAYESIEAKIFVMIAGVIPLGIAMEKTGVDKLLAQQILNYTAGWTPFVMLLVFFWVAALLTQILSDAATTVLLAPIALAFAKGASISPTAAVVTVTVGAVASFLTPIGHHGNLLILTPGGYRFSDFLKIGLPLTIILSALTCYLALVSWH